MKTSAGREGKPPETAGRVDLLGLGQRGPATWCFHLVLTGWAPAAAANILAVASMDRVLRFGARILCEAAQAAPGRASGGTERVAGRRGGCRTHGVLARRLVASPMMIRSNRRAAVRSFSRPRPLREAPLPAISTPPAAPGPRAVRRAAVVRPLLCPAGALPAAPGTRLHMIFSGSLRSRNQRME